MKATAEEIDDFSGKFPSCLMPIGELRKRLAIDLGRNFIVPSTSNPRYDRLCSITEKYSGDKTARRCLEDKISYQTLLIELALNAESD